MQTKASELQKQLQTIPLSDNQNNREHIFFSSRKPERNVNVLEKYVTMTERKTLRKQSIIKQGRFGSTKKEHDVRKCLFSDSIEEEEPQKTRRGNNRESLGLLPDALLNNDVSDADINFLINADDVLRDNRESMLSSNRKKKFISNSCVNLSICEEPKVSVKSLYSNDEIKCTLNDLLHNYNRQMILNVFHNLNEDLHLQITKQVHNEDTSVL